MILAKPDLNLDQMKLEASVAAMIAEIGTREGWYLREKFVDRSRFDPFYIIHFRATIPSEGDDLLDEPLFQIKGGFKLKLMTRDPTKETSSATRPYWRKVTSAELTARLERFLEMFRKNYLQPPGYRDERVGGKQEHPKFDKKRFVYKLESPGESIVGVGPAMYAGRPAGGALSGQLLDDESGEALAFHTVRLISMETTITRTTDKDGNFWFSRTPKGDYKIEVLDKDSSVQVLSSDDFGAIEAHISGPNENPIKHVETRFEAPDREVFSAFSDIQGRAESGPLPAFPYTVTVPGFLFTGKLTYTAKGSISGLVLDKGGLPLTGKSVEISKGTELVGVVNTDEKGEFKFTNLASAAYSISLPGYRIYAFKTTPTQTQGGNSGPDAPLHVKINANEETDH